MAKAAEFFLSDGIILTGSATGEPVNFREMQILKEHTRIPVLVGSGVNSNNFEQFLNANAMVIGSYFKQDGHWSNPLVFDKVNAFMSKIERMRR